MENGCPNTGPEVKSKVEKGARYRVGMVEIVWGKMTYKLQTPWIGKHENNSDQHPQAEVAKLHNIKIEYWLLIFGVGM